MHAPAMANTSKAHRSCSSSKGSGTSTGGAAMDGIGRSAEGGLAQPGQEQDRDGYEDRPGRPAAGGLSVAEVLYAGSAFGSGAAAADLRSSFPEASGPLIALISTGANCHKTIGRQPDHCT